MFFQKKTKNSLTPPSKPKRHREPVDLKSVKQHQKREEQRIRQLEKAQKEKRLGVYIHIPFCKSKCAYCDFYSLPNAEGQMDAYLRALLAQIDEVAPSVEGMTVDSVYIGGGTPSYFGEKRLKELLKRVNKTFQLDKNCEFTVECNPDSVTKGLISTLVKGGVNRISLGMQSAQDDELAAVGRPHTFQQVQEAVELIRKGKIHNLSLDLIYGLPEQSMEDWQQSVEAALVLQPEHLSLYGLTLEEGTPLWNQRETTPMADDDEQASRYLWAVERLAQDGYVQYEISNFAKEGRESRHNLKYWLGEEYVGFGPGAHSDVGGCRYSYLKDLKGYIQAMESGGQIVEESNQMLPQERAREYLIFRLRTRYGVEEEVYRNRYRMNFTPIEEKLRTFAEHGWAVQDGSCWRLTPEGFLVSNQLIGQLLEVQEQATLESTVSYLKRKKETANPSGVHGESIGD